MERLRGTCISIHASAREATRGATFQADHKIISIHASAREATLPPFPFIIFIKISIHASAREATQGDDPECINQLQFQSTPPRGRRRYHTYSARPPPGISIHASAREATQFAHLTKDLDLFQSTSPRGRRHPV